jgi:hypothetical protein
MVGFHRIPVTSRATARAVFGSRDELRRKFVDEAWLPEEPEEISAMGPLRCEKVVLRKGVVSIGKFAHLFRKEDGLGRFMTPRAFYSRYEKENVKRGYVVDGWKPKGPEFVAAGSFR